jgi:TRAP-type C4-dicarboxylate transport system substrate-binding protein
VIEPHLISQDVTEQPLTEVINGDVDIVLTDLTEVGAMIPELAFLQSPGLFNDVAEMNKIWTSEMGDYLRSKALKKEFTLAAFEISGFSHFLTAQPIAHFEEVQNNMVGIPEKGFDGLLLERLDLNTRMVEPEQILPAVADGVIPTYSATMEQMASSNVKFAAKISSAG